MISWHSTRRRSCLQTTKIFGLPGSQTVKTSPPAPDSCPRHGQLFKKALFWDKLYVPEGYEPKFDFPLSPSSARLTHVADRLWMQEIEFTDSEFTWAIPFDTPKKAPSGEPNG